MKKLKIMLAACAMLVSMGSFALPYSATLTIDGSVDYRALGIESEAIPSPLAGIFGTPGAGVMTWFGTFDWSVSETGTAPGFSEDANWFLSGEGGYEYGWAVGPEENPDFSDGGGDVGAFGPAPLGVGSVSDIFSGAITGYGDILPAIGGLLSATPTLTDVLTAVNSILAAPFSLVGLPAETDSIWFQIVDSNTIAFASNLGLTVNHDGIDRDPDTAGAAFGGSLTLLAEPLRSEVPVPGIIYLFALGLAGIFVSRAKRQAH